MAIAGGSVSSKFIQNGGKAGGFIPITFACWLNLPATAASSGQLEYFWFLQTTHSSGDRSYFNPHAVSVNSGATNWEIGINIADANLGSFDYSTSQQFSAGWHHYCVTIQNNGTAGTFGANCANQYLDGTYDPPGSQPPTPFAGFNNDYPSGNTNQLDTGTAGTALQIAFPAVWNIILTPAQITELTNRSDPRRVAPQNLISFSFFSGNTPGEQNSQPDLCSSPPFAISGSVFTFVPNPRLRMVIGI